PFDFRPDLHHLASGLVADDVRLGDERPAEAVEGVAPLDRHRLHADDDPLGVARRIGNVFVAEDLRAAVLVIDRRLHDRFLPCPAKRVRAASAARTSPARLTPGASPRSAWKECFPPGP